MRQTLAMIMIALALIMIGAGAGKAQSPLSLRIRYLSAGIAITSTGTPSLNATYSVDESWQPKIVAISTYIVINNRFPAGQTLLPWPDMQGGVHLFQSPAQFQAFASAIADYVAEVELGLLQQNDIFPAASATIP